MSGADLPALVPDIVEITRRASREILRIYNRGFDVRGKEDASPITEADEASEALILSGLKSLTPDIPAFGEEAVSRGEANAEALPNRFWLVDPLDGTREFVSRNGEFAICIGLVEARHPILGVLHAPVLDTTWSAAGAGTACVRRASARPEPIRARRPPASGMIAVQSRSHGDRAAVEALCAEHGVSEIRIQGSAIKLGALAEGQADFYPRFGPTMEWDTCAGHAILEAAGGSLRTMAGGPLLYGKPGFRNPDFIARGIVDR
ncbi:MAG: 3'(2'),5'-bisphosphate nucleotidase CysQ [Alphaproteobacteria bacterium]|nr:3'(2'),5'-bisphosphate nucleotidase CysQ [Alphaproteobacteria bacterium]